MSWEGERRGQRESKGRKGTKAVEREKSRHSRHMTLKKPLMKL